MRQPRANTNLPRSPSYNQLDSLGFPFQGKCAHTAPSFAFLVVSELLLCSNFKAKQRRLWTLTLIPSCILRTRFRTVSFVAHRPFLASQQLTTTIVNLWYPSSRQNATEKGIETKESRTFSSLNTPTLIVLTVYREIQLSSSKLVLKPARKVRDLPCQDITLFTSPLSAGYIEGHLVPVLKLGFQGFGSGASVYLEADAFARVGLSVDAHASANVKVGATPALAARPRKGKRDAYLLPYGHQTRSELALRNKRSADTNVQGHAKGGFSGRRQRDQFTRPKIKAVPSFSGLRPRDRLQFTMTNQGLKVRCAIFLDILLQTTLVTIGVNRV